MTTEPSRQVLVFGDREIPYDLQVEPRRRLRITVKPDLSVRVAAPAGFSIAAIETAVRTKSRWIAKQLDEVARYHPLPRPLRYVSGETLLYLGRQYRLRVEQGPAQPAKLRGKFLAVTVEEKSDARKVRGAVDAWYRTRAQNVFTKSFQRCLAIAKRHGANEATIAIRRMRSRWGSCSKSNRITLNLHLAQAPVHCIDYVVMHELVHTIEHNHSTNFYNLLTRCMPDWEDRRRLLNREVILPQEEIRLR